MSLFSNEKRNARRVRDTSIRLLISPPLHLSTSRTANARVVLRLSCVGVATVYQADRVLHPVPLTARVELSKRLRPRWRETRLLEGVSGAIPSSLGVPKLTRISRGSQISRRSTRPCQRRRNFATDGTVSAKLGGADAN